MPDGDNGDKKAREDGGDGLKATVAFARDAGIGITGLSWLVVLYAISLGSAFIILSATVFQSTTIQDSADRAGNILKVLRIIPEREASIIDQLDVTRQTVQDRKLRLRSEDAERQAAEARLSKAFDGLVETAADLDVWAGRPVGPSRREDPNEIDWRAYSLAIEAIFEEVLPGIEGDADRNTLTALRDNLSRSVAGVLAALSEADRAARAYDNTSILFKLDTQELDRLRQARDTIRDKIFDEYEIPAEAQANVSQVLNTHVSVLIHLVQLPSEFLTFALTVSMGLLGSTIHMSRELFRKDDFNAGAVTVMWFVARPLEGMAAAIIIYIFFRAGQLTLTGGGASDNKLDDLNPYVLSFLAIASGLLSEKAYNRIVVGARNLLGGEEERKSAAEGGADVTGSVADRAASKGPAADAAGTEPPPPADGARSPVR